MPPQPASVLANEELSELRHARPPAGAELRTGHKAPLQQQDETFAPWQEEERAGSHRAQTSSQG